MFSSAIERLNDRRDAVGDAGEDAGFTLIELMVVLLILAILLAIAIPTFLGVTKSANDRAAQSNLNTALVNAKSIFQQQGQTYALSGTASAAYATTNAASLAASLYTAEPSLSYVTGAVTTHHGPALSACRCPPTGPASPWPSRPRVPAPAGTSSTTPPVDRATAWTTTGPARAGTWYGKELSSVSGATCNASAIPSTPDRCGVAAKLLP